MRYIFIGDKMSLTVTTYEEMQANNAFIERDLQRVSNKIENLQELMKSYIKEKKEQFEEIQEFMSDFSSQLLFTDDKDLIQLLEIEKQIDKLTNEIKEKSLIERVRYLLDSALECIDYHINKKTDS